MTSVADETREIVPRETLTEDSTALVALGAIVRTAIDEWGAHADVSEFVRGVAVQPLTFSLTVPEAAVSKVRDLLAGFRRDHGIDLNLTVEGRTVFFTVPADVLGKHGRDTTYRNNTCRGELCRVAQSRRVGLQKLARLKRLEEQNAACDPKVHPHGTVTGYMNHGCRGEYCRAAWASQAQARRHVEAKQVEALAAADC